MIVATPLTDDEAREDAQLRATNEADLAAWRDFLDLIVPLTVELGRTRLTARAILELEAHALIQLSRSSGEGVDVLASGKHVARGEIIMIEDRTGVRISEVVTPQEN